MRFALISLGSLFVISSSQAHGGEITLGTRAAELNATVTTTAGWHTDNEDGYGTNDDYGEIYQRLNLLGTYASWRVGLRLDTSLFYEPNSGDETRSNRATPEKASLGYTSRLFEINLGDSYFSLGRGLALSLRKVDELGIDTTARGAKLLIHGRTLGATLLAGYSNINNVDEATGTHADDPMDLIGGAQAQARIWDKVTLGVHGAVVQFHDQLFGFVPPGEEGEIYRDRYIQYGSSIDAPRLTDHLGFYLEGVGQFRDPAPDDDDKTGYGLYGTATWFGERMTVLFEGKAYGDIRPVQPNLDPLEFSSVVYNSPPTVERVLQMIDHPQTDIVGGRIQVDWRFANGLLAHVNYGGFRDYYGYANPEELSQDLPATIHDPYAGIEAGWDNARSRALVQAGLRAVLLDETGAMVRSDAHVDYDVVLATGRRVSFELNGIHRERTKYESGLLDESFREGTLQLGVRVGSQVSVSGGYDYTTEASQPKRDYFSGVLQWDITPASSVRLFAGAIRGGLKCVSGVCRVYAPFEGIKLSATFRF